MKNPQIVQKYVITFLKTKPVSEQSSLKHSLTLHRFHNFYENSVGTVGSKIVEISCKMREIVAKSPSLRSIRTGSGCLAAMPVPLPPPRRIHPRDSRNFPV